MTTSPSSSDASQAEPSKLRLESRFAHPDLAYTMVIDAHRDLSEEQSHELNARLVLILANHIGDHDVLSEALTLAQKNLAP